MVMPMQQTQYVSISRLSEHLQPQDSFISRCLPRDNCCAMVEQLLTFPGVYVLAVGSRSCLQFMYFSLQGHPHCRRLFYIPQRLEECVDSSHLEGVEKAVRQAVSQGAGGVILYLCCADVLIGTDFTHLCSLLERETGVLIRPLYRGIVATRRKSALRAAMDILRDLLVSAAKDSSMEEHWVALLSKRRLAADSVLFDLLQRNGCQAVTNHCETMEEFTLLTRCRLAISFDSFGDGLAEMLHQCSGTEVVHAHGHFDLSMIKEELKQLSAALGFETGENSRYERLQAAVRTAWTQPMNRSLAIGCESGNLELAASLLGLGLRVDIVFCSTVNSEDAKWMDEIAARNPHLLVCFDSCFNEKAALPERQKITTAIGAKAGFFCKNARRVSQDEECTFGYEKLIRLLEAMA